MFNHYRDIMDVYDVAEALCIGKNRVYEFVRGRCLKRFPDWQGMENSKGCCRGIYLNTEQAEIITDLVRGFKGLCALSSEAFVSPVTLYSHAGTTWYTPNINKTEKKIYICICSRFSAFHMNYVMDIETKTENLLDISDVTLNNPASVSLLSGTWKPQIRF